MKVLCAFGLSVALCSVPASAQQASFTATSANVSQPGGPIKIRILRWSTDEERTPIVAALNAPPPAPAAAGDGRGAARGGRAGRGGRGRGRGEPAAPLTPIAALTSALGRAPTLGYIWTNDVTGYSVKYAYRIATADGGERIILATDRRLGAYSPAWKPVAATPAPDYEFTLIEMRLSPKGIGEGKTSLTTNVMVDNEAKTVALENYVATPAILQNVKR